MPTCPRPLLLAALLAACALGSCRSPRRPDALPQEVDQLRDPRALGPYLEAYPLGDRGVRVDLLAATAERSMHLVQARRVIPAHYHPTRTEISYVVTGRGTVFVDGRSYPAVAGSAFRVLAGTVHSVHPEEDAPLVAVVYFEPPLLEGTDRVLVDGE